jgi:hypothetical protein
MDVSTMGISIVLRQTFLPPDRSESAMINDDDFQVSSVMNQMLEVEDIQHETMVLMKQ